MAEAVIEQELKIPLAPTQQAFVESEAPIVALIGPEGEGKTYAGFAALLRHAQNHIDDDLPVRAALIRDTHENIKNKTRPSIDKAIAAIARLNNTPELVNEFEWHRDDKILACRSLGLILDLFGADDNASVAKLQGGDQWSFIWLEEPAPMYKGNNAGMPKSVFNAALSRAARGMGVSGSMRLQITMNPADEDHWTYSTLVSKPLQRPKEMPDIWTDTFNIPYGENPTRTDLQRQATKAAYKDDPALYARLVDGKFAFVQIGEAVTPEYRDIHHFERPGVPYDLRVIPGAQGFRSWDGGHNPTCLMGQITPGGHMNIIHAFRMPHVAMKQLIELRVLPTMNLHYREVKDWIDTGDPTLTTGDQGDITKSPAYWINKLLGGNFQESEHWPAVKEPMKNALGMLIDGKPYIRVGKHAEILHKALRGGWHYAKTNSGLVLRNKPEKDEHSHPGDCFGALCLKLLGRKVKDGKPRAKPVKTGIYG